MDLQLYLPAQAPEVRHTAGSALGALGAKPVAALMVAAFLSRRRMK